MEEERKLIIFYLLPHRFSESTKPEVYAWTLDKQMAQDFEAQREPKCFFKRKVRANKEDAGIFMTSYTENKLINEILSDKHGIDYHIVCTMEESQVLNEEFDNVLTTIDEIYRMLVENSVHLRKDINDRLIDIAERATHMKLNNVRGMWMDAYGNAYDKGCSIDTFRLFYDTFRYTFVKEDYYE